MTEDQEGYLDQLCNDLASGEDDRAENAALALAQRMEKALPRLMTLLEGDRPEARWWSVRALALCDDPQARARLRETLADTDPAVRQCAALALRLNPNPNAIPELLEALASPDRLLARLAGDALIAIGEPSLEPLGEALRSTDPAVRGEAARALARLEDPKAIPLLFEALNDASILVRHWADLGLERMGVGMAFFRP
jgi:HEAT repeat protein